MSVQSCLACLSSLVICPVLSDRLLQNFFCSVIIETGFIIYDHFLKLAK